MEDRTWTLYKISEVDAMKLAWESVMVLIINEDQRIEHSTAEANKFFGYVPGELNGKFLDVLIPPEYKKAHSKHFDGFFNNPVDRTMGSGVQTIFEGVKKNGERIKVSIWLRVRAVEGVKKAVAKIFPVIEISKPTKTTL